jgi:nitrogen regulatory protein P-II 1
MKRIEAIVASHRLSKVVMALHGLPKFPGFTVFEGQGQGHGRGQGGHYSHKPDDRLLYDRCSVVVVICEDDEAKAVAQSVVQAAHTGRPGDGIITISDVAELIHIHGSGAGS